MYPVAIKLRRVILRELSEDDLDATMSIVGEPEVVRYLSFDARTREDQARALKDILEHAKATPRDDYYLAIVSPESAEFIGLIRIRTTYNRAGQLGYGIRRSRWGNGYATESIVGMLNFAFEVLGLHRVEATYRDENVRSAELLKRLGFTLEGRLRDHVFTDGRWRDSVLSSLLRHEWHQPAADPAADSY